MASKIRRRRRQVIIPGIPASVGIQNEYARSIRRLIKQMEKAALKFVLEKYKLFRASEMVTNDAPIDFDNRRLQQLIDAIKARFGRYISEWEAEEMDAIASKFIGKIDKQTKAGLMANLKKAGIVIDFHISALHQPLLEEMVASNVNLIKSIAPKYFDKLTNVVIDSALKGRDMASIFQHIKDLNKVTERRAELIAIDQTNKATQALNVMQTKDIGIKKGIWIHIPGEKKLTDNTEAFVQGKKANNVLLFGDSGTGKSTSIKAIVNQYYDGGLRMTEIYKHQFKYLSKIIAAIKNRNYRFIIYMDDLSFEEHEIEYKFLKTAIVTGKQWP